MICDDCLKATRDKCEKDISLKPKKECWIAYLEKIKEEVEELECLRDNPYNNETEYSVSMTELRELFDKHIAELKGENNAKNI